MTIDTSYRINTERFAHETVDAEVIVIDMVEGNYFSMRDTAAVIWHLLDQSLPVAGIIAALERASGASSSEVATAVDTFLRQLMDEQIVQAEPRAHQGKPAVPALPAMTFGVPVVEKFSEMQDLLTLDPIHEVDETGWPHRH